MSDENQDKEFHPLASFEHRVLILRNVEVGFLDSLKYGLKGAGCYSSDSRIHDSLLPVPKSSGKRKIDIIATTFDQDMTSNQVLEVIAEEGLELLPFHTVIEFCHDERSWDYNTIPCLRNKLASNPLCPGLDEVPVIQHFPTSQILHEKFKRVVDLARFGQIWPSGTLFPCRLIGT